MTMAVAGTAAAAIPGVTAMGAASPALIAGIGSLGAGAAGAGGGLAALSQAISFLTSDAGTGLAQAGVGLLGQGLQNRAARDLAEEDFDRYMQSLPLEAGLRGVTQPFTPQTALPISIARQGIGLQPNTAANMVRF